MNLDDLNEGQRKAVEEINGPVMVLAGAGSGKTRTLVKRISYLLNEKKVGPYELLALTFSNRAAKEMRDRIARSTLAASGSLQVTTFHAFCSKVLRSEYRYLGLGRNFTIYDKGESKSLVKSLLQKRGVGPKEISPLSILYYIDELKNNGYYQGREESPAGQLIRTDSFCPDTNHKYFSYFTEYEAELLKSNALDFGGLITGVLKLFETFPEIVERYQKKFRYIMVDEYQDTNRAQFELIYSLSRLHQNLCVVGDEDQSIYSWRGADIRNILEFNQFYPNFKTIKLEQNYRSSKNIIEAASCVISKNQARSDKKIWTDNPAGNNINIIELLNDKDEADYIAKEISRLVHDENISLKEIAIFYRNNFQSRVIEESLRRKNIPFRVIGGIEFYQRKEIKDMISYLKLVVNPKDSLALVRVINTPARGIGPTTIRKLEVEAIEQNCSLWEILGKIVENPQNYFHLKMTNKVRTSINEFYLLIQETQDGVKLNQAKAFWAYEKLLKGSGLLDHLKAQKDYESMAKVENVEELGHAIKQYEDQDKSGHLEGFLENVAMIGQTEQSDEDKKDIGDVSLMTVHGSKGLEFGYVFLVGVEDHLFPSTQSMDEDELRFEEERRLFYVAMTRAMHQLYISFAQGRMLYGQLKFNGPSRFLFEIPQECYVWKKWSNETDKGDRYSYEKSSVKSGHHQEIVYDREYLAKKNMIEETFPKGSQVLHQLYGKGKVLEVSGVGKDEKVVIQFLGGPKKRFMVKYAPLSLVD